MQLHRHTIGRQAERERLGERDGEVLLAHVCQQKVPDASVAMLLLLLAGLIQHKSERLTPNQNALSLSPLTFTCCNAVDDGEDTGGQKNNKEKKAPTREKEEHSVQPPH